MRRAERERARVQQQSIGNKLFTLVGTNESGHPIYSPAPQVQQVCQVVDGFIYVANAEPGKGKTSAAAVSHHAHWLLSFKSPAQDICMEPMSSIGEGESEVAQIRAVLSSGGGSAPRPLLVLSCVSREESEATTLQAAPRRNRARCRTPCVDMAMRLGLPQLANPWMVISWYLNKIKGFTAYKSIRCQSEDYFKPCLCFPLLSRCRTQ